MKNVILTSFVTAAFLSSLSTATEHVTATSKKPDTSAVTYLFLKREYANAKRTSFWIDARSDQKNLMVTAVCDLRKGKRGLGRFPLQSVKTGKDKQTMRFRVSCLADEFIADTVIRVYVRDDQTGKTVSSMKVALSDAKWVAPPSKQERPQN